MAVQTGQATTANSAASDMSEEDRSKEKFYEDVAALGNSMIAVHGREFAMGVLVLAARFIAESKPLTTQADAATSCGSDCKDHDHKHKN
jgi:hypothetical protein